MAESELLKTPKPAETPAAGKDMPDEKASAARAADDRSSIRQRYAVDEQAKSTAASQSSASQPRGGTRDSESASAMPAAAGRAEEKRGEALQQQQQGQAAAQQLGRADSLRVLFVLRAEPAATTTPASAASAKPATSLPATDPAK